MAYPSKPTIRTSYTAKAQALGDGTLPGQELDVDLGALRTSIDEYIDFLRGITRSDGRLANGSVRRETLAGDILIGFDPPSAWVTGTAYVQNATVFQDARFYICTTAHTSGTFSTDLAAGRWELLADFSNVAGDVLSGNQIISGNWRFDGTVNTTGGFFINGAPVTVNTPSEALALMGVSATAAEINVLDGVTASTAELNILDGVTASTAELNSLDGVTTAGTTIMRAADAAAQRTALGLGSAATLTAGTSANNVVQLDGSGRLPAIDIRNATNVPGAWVYSSVFDLSSGAGEYDLGSIPAGVTDIEVYIRGGSLSGTDNFLIQFGTGGSPTTSGYGSNSATQVNSNGDTVTATSDAGFVGRNGGAASAMDFVFRASRQPSSNAWMCDHQGCIVTGSYTIDGIGSVALAGALDIVRLTRTGTNTFDAGSAWVRYR